MKSKTKILFIYSILSRGNTFIENDKKILKKHFEIKEMTWEGKKSIPKIFVNMLKIDICFLWFLGDFSIPVTFFSKLLNKKTIIITGGYDVASVPELNYGNFKKDNLKSKFLKWSLEQANLVLPVSKFTEKETLKRGIPKNMKLLYNGIDIKYFKEKGKKDKKLIISIGSINEQNLIRKGILPFVFLAKILPDYNFIMIGKFKDQSINMLKEFINKNELNNIKFTDYISNKEKLNYLQKASFIFQLSEYEAFGIAPLEGMLCGCVPIISNHESGMHEFVTDKKLYVNPFDFVSMVEIIKNYKEKINQKFLINNFSLDMREKKLIKFIGELK